MLIFEYKCQTACTDTNRSWTSITLFLRNTSLYIFLFFWCSRRLCYDMKLSEPWMKFFKFNSKIIYLWCLFLLCFFLLDFSLFLRVSKIRFVGSGRNSYHAPLTAVKSFPPEDHKIFPHFVSSTNIFAHFARKSEIIINRLKLYLNYILIKKEEEKCYISKIHLNWRGEN